MSSTTPGKTKSSLPSTQELNSLPAIQIPENFAPGDSICVLSAIAPGPQLRLLSHLSVELGCSLPLVLLLLCEWGAYIALHPAPSAGTQPGCLFCSPHGPQDQAVHSLPSALGIEQPACVPQGIVSGRPPSLSPLRQFPGLTLRPTSVTTQVTHPELEGRPHAALLRLPSGSVSPPAAQGAICAGPPPPSLPPAPPHVPGDRVGRLGTRTDLYTTYTLFGLRQTWGEAWTPQSSLRTGSVVSLWLSQALEMTQPFLASVPIAALSVLLDSLLQAARS